MGDRWYTQQNRKVSQVRTQESKPKRKLKKDYIAEIDNLLGRSISGLDKCTIDTLTNLIEGIKEKCN